jgi:UMF1 family MFS transporter
MKTQALKINTPFNVKAVIAWCIYDWGISAFSVIVTTFVIATYFTNKIAVNDIVGTHQWGNAIAVAGFFLAVFSPIFGAIADYGGRRKCWLAGFSLLTMISSAFLWYAYPSPNAVAFTLTWVILGTFGANICMVFYNSLLPDLSPQDYLGRISGWGWGLGYFGGLAALSIALYGFIQAKPTWLNTETFEQIRICGPLVALWFAVFALPLFVMIPEPSNQKESLLIAVQLGLKNLYRTLKQLPRQKELFTFLIAQMIYIDGLNTIFAFAGIYAAGTFHMDITQIILYGIVMNIFAGVGCIALSWLDDALGAKFIILLSLFFLILLGLVIVLVTSKIEFWIFSGLLSLFVGPVQSSTRALMAKLVPKEKSAEMFGLYISSGKVTTFLGPLLLGTVTFYFDSQRVGMGSVLLFFLIGALLLWRVHEPNGHSS